MPFKTFQYKRDMRRTTTLECADDRDASMAEAGRRRALTEIPQLPLDRRRAMRPPALSCVQSPFSLHICHCSAANAAVGECVRDVTDRGSRRIAVRWPTADDLECGYAGCDFVPVLQQLWQSPGTLSPRERNAALKAGTLDETRWLRPAAAIWLDEAQGWSPRCHDMLEFLAQGPEDYARIAAAYRGVSSLSDPHDLRRLRVPRSTPAVAIQLCAHRAVSV